VEKAAREALEKISVAGDLHADATYRRHLGVVAARRAIQQAYGRAA
jgi:CO/xanthine dehydrogenase FAD-binding subunit